MDARWMVAGVVGLGIALGGVGVAPAWARQVEGAEQAQADEDDEMLQEMMVLSIPRESAAFYADLMDLDELQREVALEMHRAYLGQYRDAAVKMRDVMRTLEEKMSGEDADWEQAQAMMADMMKVAMGFMERVVTLGEQYVQDLGALAASEDQRAAHERVVRTRAREMAVAMSTMNGGTSAGLVDLVAIARSMDPPVLPEDGAMGDAGPAQQALYEYERELGELCAPFVDRVLAAFREMAQAMSEGDQAWDGEDRMEQEMEAMIERISAVNERSARRIHNAMPASMRDAWDLAYKKARWPQVYAPSDFHRTHDAALALEGLSGEQREGIEAAMNQYVREAEPANRKWIDAIAEQEAASRDMSGEWNQEKWQAYQAMQEAVQQARADRAALDERFAQRVLAILTPEQRDAMPTTTGGAVDADEVIRQMGGG
ncbi:MAG: hypothetical protein RIE32_06980 [Phycisphaerales bacterium]